MVAKWSIRKRRAALFVVAGLDPAIHAELPNEELLDLCAGQPPPWHTLRRND